jgi:hypothetical protein
MLHLPVNARVNIFSLFSLLLHAPRYREDIVQIEKDVNTGRSDARSLSHDELAEFLERGDGTDAATMRIILRRLLGAFVKRNRRHGGYTQGMNMLTRVLLAFLDEEPVFWMLCTIVEQLRLPDFYSPPPASMNGFMIERNAAAILLLEVLPGLAPDKDLVTNVVEILSPKWYCV